jgi:hypothetical protein
MKSSHPYGESLLHWLWKNRFLQNQEITTAKEKEVQIHHPGYANGSDGPDFLNARITIGSLKWHGDVEIHWNRKDWQRHKHHTDANYNRVVLHVVFDDDESIEARRLDDTVMPTLCMKAWLPKPLRYFLDRYRQPESLPCAGSLSSIAEASLKEQFERAHTEYFEQKVDDLLVFYDPALPMSQAWQHLLIIAFFDGLGINNNREPMQRLARQLLSREKAPASEKALTATALKVAGIEPEISVPELNWKRKGSRPVNHPGNRIPQACKVLWFIKNKPFKWWLRTDSKESYSELLQHIDTDPGLGRHRSGILFGTVWLPSFYLLGEFTARRSRSLEAKNRWLKHRTRLPQSIIKPFKQAGMPAPVFEQMLGTVHQYRAYCSRLDCRRCGVFQSIISS